MLFGVAQIYIYICMRLCLWSRVWGKVTLCLSLFRCFWQKVYKGDLCLQFMHSMNSACVESLKISVISNSHGSPRDPILIVLVIFAADPPNHLEAVKWLYKASIAGHVRAQYQLALCLHQGRVVNQNLRKAVQNCSDLFF